MTFDQIESAYRMGKPHKGHSVESHEDAMMITRNWRRHIGL
jgi:hypothetical protein